MKTKNPAPAAQVAKFRELARDLIKHHFGSRPRRIVHKSAGLTNFVFAFKNSEGEFVVRISPDKARLNAFIKEQWAERAARREGVPTAEILETGISVIPFPYMITRAVDGAEATYHPERAKIIREMARHAASMNSIRTKGFGETFDWSNNQLSRSESWKDYLENEYRFGEKIAVLDRARICPAATIKQLKTIFRSLASVKPKPVLNHGDLRLKNVIVDEAGKIRAIIDWENATSNLAPHWELSLALHDLGIDEKQHFIEGYGLKPKKLEEIAPFIKAFNIMNYLPEIDRTISAKDKSAIERIKLRLAGAFDLYSF